MQISLAGILVVSLVSMGLSSHMVIKRLKASYPGLYKSWGEPEFGMFAFDSGWGFVAGFAGMLGYRNKQLDKATLGWCHMLFISYWLMWGIAVVFIWQILSA